MVKTISKDLDDLMILVTQKDCTELKKLIIENPQAPLIIFAGEEANSGQWSYESVDSGYPVLEEITLYDEFWFTKDDYEDRLRDDMAYDERYKDLPDAEFDAEVEKIISETAFVKAIVIYVG